MTVRHEAVLERRENYGHTITVQILRKAFILMADVFILMEETLNRMKKENKLFDFNFILLDPDRNTDVITDHMFQFGNISLISKSNRISTRGGVLENVLGLEDVLEDTF